MFGGKRYDNSFPAAKIALREWIADQFESPSVLDVYGGWGMMERQVWKRKAKIYQAIEGEALAWLESQTELNHDIFDVDPWGSPYEALESINRKATQSKIGIVCTDGFLRSRGKMRLRLSPLLQQVMGWPSKDNHLLASIYYNYGSYLRAVLPRLMTNFEIERLAIKIGRGSGKTGTCYFAAKLTRI
jgi:hypothetical protein